MLRITDIVRLLKKTGGLQTIDFTLAGSAAATAANYTVPLGIVGTNPMVITSVVVRYAVASTSGTLQVKKCGATVAVGSGTDVLASTIDLSATAETNYSGTLTTTAANLIIRPGDALYLVAGGTLTSQSGLGVRIVVQNLPFNEIRDL
jgi:hypothetical protein